jgi:hypothetical protein
VGLSCKPAIYPQVLAVQDLLNSPETSENFPPNLSSVFNPKTDREESMEPSLHSLDRISIFRQKPQMNFARAGSYKHWHTAGIRL